MSSLATTSPSSDYVFRLKKGDLELEVQSNDAAFMEAQMENWRNILVQSTASPANKL